MSKKKTVSFGLCGLTGPDSKGKTGFDPGCDKDSKFSLFF